MSEREKNVGRGRVCCVALNIFFEHVACTYTTHKAELNCKTNHVLKLETYEKSEASSLCLGVKRVEHNTNTAQKRVLSHVPPNN